MDGFSYSIVLFNDNVIKNIANFCCTEKVGFKSPLVFDFTFELLKLPPFYALIGAYKNTSLFSKGTQRCPTMLGPVLLCHSRKEATAKIIFDSMFESCPGLASFVQVIGCDDEKALSNIGCDAFPVAILLLCANHAKKNVQEKLRDLVNDNELRKVVNSSIFGSDFTKGLIHSVSPAEFDEKFAVLCAKWNEDERLQKFAQYFEVHKADKFRYHLIKGMVDKAQIVDTNDLFTTNLVECINNVIKIWQNGKKDPYNFAICYKKMLDQQESNVVGAFLGLDSPYEVRKEFQELCRNFATQYASKLPEEKAADKEIAY